MHLSKLRLTGFKSFVEPTDFLVEPGVTGIIGPNGCGKSNLVEALRWVMGENSYKNMRASGMDDVIFSGAGDRPARNFAEVCLVLDNAARTAPAAFNDADVLEVTRKIEREQGSTYRINGREVRARDVQILFADASTGARSPALVRQGQISEIIAAKPQARRRILEEAAGVAGLHTRRHEAELRLKGAEDNLVRIGDLIGQISSQADGLRRQARQATRYRELQGDIRRTQALAVLIDFEAAKREVAEAEASLTAASADVVERTRAQAEAARHQAVAAHALPELRDAEGAAGTALQRFIVARETLDGEERRAKGRLAELERRLNEMAADLSRDATVLDDAEGAIRRLEAEAAELGAAQSSEDVEAALREKLAATERERASLETRLAETQAAQAQAAAERKSLSARLAEETSRLARRERDLAQTLQSRNTLAGSLDQAAFDTAVAQVTQGAATLAEAEVAAQSAEQALAAAREQEQADRARMAEADRTLQRLETEVRTLAKLLEGGSGSKWPPILDLVRATPGYEMALGAALGDDLDASSDPAAPAHWSEAACPADAPLPEGAEPLLAHVEAPAALRLRLAQIGLVDAASGPALREKLAQGQQLVSRDGDIWRWDGFVQTAGAPTPAARRLVERNRLTSLRAETEAARTAHESLRTAALHSQEALRAASAQEAAARTGLQTARRALDAARDAQARIDRQQADARARLAALDAAEASGRVARDEALRRQAELQTTLDAAPVAEDLTPQLDALSQQSAACRATETETRALLQSLTRERETRARRLAAIDTEQTSWRTRIAQTRAHREDIEARLATTTAERDTLADAPDMFVVTRRRILSDNETAEAALRQATDRRTAAETVLSDADRGARAALDAMAEAREAKARSEAMSLAAQQKLEAVVRTAAAELECEPPALATLAGIKPDQPRPAAAQVAAKLDQLKGDRERLGAVNLRADEELTALESQREGLDKEKDELTEAIRRLRQAIGTLNKEGRERLLGAFGTVNAHFKELFTLLFGGGTAELQLVESDDPLEAGLEILARPPGKKPQVMTLLSGGEQALTAISLIFAVFLTNPSPICVLDEVDAPLDDANVERFCDLVDDMRKKTDTRFIAITHNPITMARMDRLFGVTQAEAGISQLVSVSLAEAEGLLEAS